MEERQHRPLSQGLVLATVALSGSLLHLFPSMFELTTENISPFKNLNLYFPSTNTSAVSYSSPEVPFGTVALIIVNTAAHCSACILKIVTNAFLLPIPLADILILKERIEITPHSGVELGIIDPTN